MLFGLAEGVVALDTNERITLVNNVAQRLLDLPEHAVGMRLDDLPIGPRLRDVLRGVTDDGSSEDVPRDQVVLRRGRVLVMNRMEVSKDGRPLGSVTTLRDRTELAAARARDRLVPQSRPSCCAPRRTSSPTSCTRSRGSSSSASTTRSCATSTRSASTGRSSTSPSRAHPRHGRDGARHGQVRAGDRAARRAAGLRRHVARRIGPRDSADVAAVVGNLVDNAIDAAASSDGRATSGSS